MKRLILRSQVFNFFFYVLTGVACVACLPTLILPRKYFMAVVRGFVHGVYFLERTFLGLDFEVRGIENLPKSGSFIVAAKHQSAYETMKLHILFKDPAVILKKELLSIPLWGLYLKKSDVIAIDRSTPDAAIVSIQEGARRMSAQGRPIVIFPQGTRVRLEESVVQKPYKVGVARIYEAVNLPIVPLALNTGLYWPRSGWLKSSGTVIFKFLKPIEPGMERARLMKALEEQIETESLSLANEGREQAASKGYGLMASMMSVAVLILVLFGVYSYTWTKVAEHVRAQYPLVLKDMVDSPDTIAKPEITGYPGKIKFYVPTETLRNDQGSVTFTEIRAESWPLPYMTTDIQTGPIEIQNIKWPEKLHFDLLKVKLDVEDGKLIEIKDSLLQQGTFKAIITGNIDLRQEPFPLLNMMLKLEDHQSLLQDLGVKGIVEARMALFMNAGLSALANPDGTVEVQVAQKENTLYAGPIPIMTLPAARVISDTIQRNPISVDETPGTQVLPAPSP
jgi:1-acyl-sn-glycerol-3-phosphate acyltransferase